MRRSWRSGKTGSRFVDCLQRCERNRAVPLRTRRFQRSGQPEESPWRRCGDPGGAERPDRVSLIATNDANEIVRYRSERGDFRDLDSLKKVPGVDAAILEERKDRIAFR